MTDNNTNYDTASEGGVTMGKNYLDLDNVLTQLPMAAAPGMIRHMRSHIDADGARQTMTVNFEFEKANVKVNTFEGERKAVSSYKNHYYSRSYRMPLADPESETTEGKYHGAWEAHNFKLLKLGDNDARLAQLIRALDSFAEIELEKALKVIDYLDGVKDMGERWSRIKKGADKLTKYFQDDRTSRNEANKRAKRFMKAMDNIANRIPDYLDAVLRHVAEGTMVTISTSGITVLRFFNEDGSVRKMGDLRAFTIDMGVPKPMKRFAAMVTQSYMFDTWDSVAMFREIDGVIYFDVNNDGVNLVDTTDWEHQDFRDQDGCINVLVKEAPEDITLIDGINIIAPHLRTDMVTNFVRREEDEERRVAYRDSFFSQERFNVRLVGPWGTIKGDGVFAQPEMVQFDFITFEENMTEGLATADGRAHMHMNPQNQFHSVRANTQSVAHFGHILNVEDALFNNMTALRQRDARNVMAGKAVGAVKHVRLNTLEDSTLKNVMERLALWTEEEGTINTSPHLSLMNANQVVRMGDVDKEHKLIRQYPTSWSTSMSVTSEYIYTMATGIELGLTSTEFVLTAYGAVFSNDEFANIMEALGGADQDDHSEFHFRRVMDKISKFDIWAGSIVALAARNPIGTNSDGDKVSSEYYVLRPRLSHEETNKFIKSFGELPELHADELPVHSTELDAGYLAACEAASKPIKPSFPNGYTMATFEEMVYDTARAIGLYGTINLLMTFCAQHDIKFELGLKPEFLIDVCEQFRAKKDLDTIKGKVDYMRAVVIDAVDSALFDGVAVDAVAWDRLGLMIDATEDDSKLINAMVQHYYAEMEKYTANARLHLRTIKEHWMEAFRNSDDKENLKAEFFLMRSIVGAGFNTQAQGLRGDVAIDKVSTYMAATIDKNERENTALTAKYDEILANVYRSFTDEKHKVDGIFPDRPFTVTMFAESRSESPVAVYANTDQVFVAKPMIKRYLKALETNRELRLAFLPVNDMVEWDDEVVARGFDPNTYFESDDSEEADGGIEA